jgi:hypothetical protein
MDDEADTSSRLPAVSKLLKHPDGFRRYQVNIETHKKLEANRRTQALIWPFKEGKEGAKQESLLTL